MNKLEIDVSPETMLIQSTCSCRPGDNENTAANRGSDCLCHSVWYDSPTIVLLVEISLATLSERGCVTASDPRHVQFFKFKLLRLLNPITFRAEALPVCVPFPLCLSHRLSLRDLWCYHD